MYETSDGRIIFFAHIAHAYMDGITDDARGIGSNGKGNNLRPYCLKMANGDFVRLKPSDYTGLVESLRAHYATMMAQTA